MEGKDGMEGWAGIAAPSAGSRRMNPFPGFPARGNDHLFSALWSVKMGGERRLRAVGASKHFGVWLVRPRGCSLRGGIPSRTRKASRCERVVEALGWEHRECFESQRGGEAVSGDGGG